MRGFFGVKIGLQTRNLFHEQHLAGALDGAGEPALVTSRQPGVFAGQQTSLICHKLFQMHWVFKVQGIDREINFWLGTRCAALIGSIAAATSFGSLPFWIIFSRHDGYY